MRNAKLKKLSNESLLGKKSTYEKGFIVLLILMAAVTVLNSYPAILGDSYPTSNLFRIIFVVCFVISYRIFREWRNTKQEIKKRGLAI